MLFNSLAWLSNFVLEIVEIFISISIPTLFIVLFWLNPHYTVFDLYKLHLVLLYTVFNIKIVIYIDIVHYVVYYYITVFCSITAAEHIYFLFAILLSLFVIVVVVNLFRILSYFCCLKLCDIVFRCHSLLAHIYLAHDCL